jgi:FlaA1/EpsC-like NDP-sugar epimerase
MMKRISRLTDIVLQQHGAVVLSIHISLISLSAVISWLLRFDFTFRDGIFLLNAIPILVLCRLAAMSRFNLLHGNWRFTGVDDATDIINASVFGSIGFILSNRFILGVHRFPISVYVIELLLTCFFITAVRVGFRVLAETAAQVHSISERKQTLVIGAGFAAQMVIREIRGTPSAHWIVGCLDDSPGKQGTKILGKPVLGTVDELPKIAAGYGIKDVLIAVPSATGTQMRRFVDICQAAGVNFFTVPSLKDLLSGKANLQQFRNVDLEDLLGRDPVRIDLASVRNVVTGRVVMVTGAAGSIGSELCRQLLGYEPARLICLDQSETGLFYLEKELGRDRTRYCVADYANAFGMQHALSSQAVDIIFHAAAYKHVPLMEENPREAVRNNVLALRELMRIADENGCKEFILISSDKAVNPSSMMGATKRIGELMLCSRPHNGMRCVTVRFGNVLGSQGSVVPVFQKQIEEDKCITVTHPEINRFFMTIPEAASLVLQASAVGQHGDILVLDMGEPIRIVDLARTLIRLSGKSEKDIPIVYTGLRPGEKLYEELFYSSERVWDTNHQKIKRTQAQIIGWKELNGHLEMLRRSMYSAAEDELRALIKGIVPEYEFGEPLVPDFTPLPHAQVWSMTSDMGMSASASD